MRRVPPPVARGARIGRHRSELLLGASSLAEESTGAGWLWRFSSIPVEGARWGPGIGKSIVTVEKRLHGRSGVPRQHDLALLQSGGLRTDLCPLPPSQSWRYKGRSFSLNRLRAWSESSGFSRQYPAALPKLWRWSWPPSSSPPAGSTSISSLSPHTPADFSSNSAARRVV